ncbi:RagB/SusD family nutrient uptake outer membrane protein [Chitinophaga sp. SYP-B3965]|uniref:RagB/SusD family nutrient uptake outer membrane protein n=1 Tax=Chitinophaga sp. SYP-B3965 TaxID=2663120 RepID=UPI0012997DC4|nr:RagB/SusD family nutrient uptake outer membrane protein [Chitinophaga sp. SYP-B3965]MRG45195.1 RagB/SusD family nutrient uptake outer membrane protein [Chitinophaga sp. SYP-B3965]
MKKLHALYLLGLFSVLSFSSCEKKFLDKAPGVDVTENTIFSSQTELEMYIASIYRHGIHHGFPTEDRSLTNAATYDMAAGATDEGEFAAGWLISQRWNSSNITASDIVNLEDYRFFLRWTAIRMCNILIERAGDVPNVTDAYRNQVIGEAKFIRALNYIEMVKRYGGVPIVDKRFQLTDNFDLGRNTLQESFNFIVSDATDAAEKLPPTYPSTMRGRATKGAALALKSRALLYAASPLSNTAQPYMSLGENDKFLCLGNNDKNRWKLAADAAKAVLDWAPGAGIHLITDKGTTANYRYQWTTNDNAEVILAAKVYGPRNAWEIPWATIKPNVLLGGRQGWAGLMATFNFVKKYEKVDGTPQTWPLAGGNDLFLKINELDPRFKQTIAYQNSQWNIEDPQLDCRTTQTGFWMHKTIPYELTNGAAQVPNWQLFRLAEAYLNYAEALNEFNDGPNADAYEAVNVIRRRSGMPELPANLSQEAFRERVHHERDIELAFEDHRFWDIRRWMVAEQNGVMQGDFWGLQLKAIPGSSEYNYVPYIYEQRTFLRKMYLHPFILSEVNKGHIVQNPGW